MKEERDFYFTRDRQIYLIWKQMNLGIQIITIDLTELIVAYQRVKIELS
ncbi:Uncharacterised protein [Staphylococcus aureus]|uniref:Uncharacterized protein n=1 Tax=Staphylococcus aureus TaxID=1280 RepID=A0A380E456_STAAU|nr:Uncharacterised protein [Staphylococcus aureus]